MNRGSGSIRGTSGSSRSFWAQQTRDGVTVFMSTHSLGVIEDAADRIGIIHHGRLLHVGTVDEIKALARDPGSLEDVFLELTQGESE